MLNFIFQDETLNGNIMNVNDGIKYKVLASRNYFQTFSLTEVLGIARSNIVK